MQETDYGDSTRIAQPVEQDVRAGGAFEVTSADGFGAPTLPTTGGKIGADGDDVPDIEIGLVFPPSGAQYGPRFRSNLRGHGEKGRNRLLRSARALFIQKSLDIERLGRAAGLALDQGHAQRLELHFVLFEQSQTGANHIAGGAIAPVRDLLIDKAGEMVAKADGRVAGHGSNSFGFAIPIYTNNWYLTNWVSLQQASQTVFGRVRDLTIHQFSMTIVEARAWL